MDNKICPECGTENEPQYPYFKNCGINLNAEAASPVTAEPQEQPHADNRNQQSGYGYNYNPYGAYNGGSIEGVPNEEVELFVGKKSYSIMPKFIKMEITRSKTSWCWPPAILGFFFGPLGAALWFFYRKMYKPAAILAAIGAVVDIIYAVLTMNYVDTYSEALFNSLDTATLADIIEAFGNMATSVPYILATALNNIATVATFVLTGLFGFSLYKNHCISKIKGFKLYNADPMYYRLGLTSLGGTSGGMLTLGIVIMLASSSISEFVTSIISLMF